MRANLLSMFFLAVALGAPAALAQDGAHRPPPPQHGPSERGGQPEARPPIPNDPAEAKKHLQRRLEDLERQQASIRDAIKKIDEGVAVPEATRGVEPPRRADRDPRGPEPRSDGRRPGDHIPRGEGSDRRLERPVTEEEARQTRAFLRQHLPAVADRFEALEKTNSEMAERGLRRMVPRVQDAEEARERDPALFQLKLAELEGSVSLVDAIRGYREAEATKDAAKIEQASSVLRAAVAKQVDTRLKLQEHEIEGLTGRLAELKADLDKKTADKAGEIDRMVKRIQEYPQRAREQGREGEPRDSQPKPPHPK